MSNISTPQALSERLRQKLETDRQAVESLTQQELEKLASDLRKACASALSSTEAAIDKTTRDALSRLGARSDMLSATLSEIERQAKTTTTLAIQNWIKLLVTGLSLFLGVSLASWGLMQFLTSRIQGQIETSAALAAEIETQQQTLKQIEAKTWGIEFKQDDQGRFLVFPAGVQPSTGWTVGKRQAVKFGM
jgi:hypothetical protein